MNKLIPYSPYHPISLIVTFFGVGRIPFAPGTMGSLATIISVSLLQFLPLGFMVVMIPWGLITVACLYLIGFETTKIYISRSSNHDPKEVVIDEVVGQLLTLVLLSPLLFGIATVLSDIYFALCILGAFLLFRFYDIKKPWLVGWAERRFDNAHGVMLDDVFAGLFAAITFYVLFALVYVGEHLLKTS